MSRTAASAREERRFELRGRVEDLFDGALINIYARFSYELWDLQIFQANIFFVAVSFLPLGVRLGFGLVEFFCCARSCRMRSRRTDAGS